MTAPAVNPVLDDAEADMDEPAQAAPIDQPTRSIDPISPIRAARLFAGPGQYPPESFAAYGVVAFRARLERRSGSASHAVRGLCRGPATHGRAEPSGCRANGDRLADR